MFSKIFFHKNLSNTFSPVKERNVSFSCPDKKRTKRNRERPVRSFVQDREHIPSAPDTCLRTAGYASHWRNTPNGKKAKAVSFAPAGAGHSSRDLLPTRRYPAMQSIA